MSIIAGAALTAGGALLGGRRSQKSAEDQQASNLAAQKEFAQSGIQWKVEDAKKAGVHPLYALGAPTQGFAPMAIQDSQGPAIADASQQIGRAVAQTQSAEEAIVADLAKKEAVSRINKNDAEASQARAMGLAALWDSRDRSQGGMPSVSSNPLLQGSPDATRFLMGVGPKGSKDSAAKRDSENIKHSYSGNPQPGFVPRTVHLPAVGNVVLPGLDESLQDSFLGEAAQLIEGAAGIGFQSAAKTAYAIRRAWDEAARRARINSKRLGWDKSSYGPDYNSGW